jgi:hypothetical protein
MKNILLIIAIIALCFERCTTHTTGGGDVVTTGSAVGYLYCKNGSPAVRADITAISSDNMPGSSLTESLQ